MENLDNEYYLTEALSRIVDIAKTAAEITSEIQRLQGHDLSKAKIGRVIQYMRKEKKMKQIDLAEYVGITQTYLSLIENNLNRPDWKVLFDLLQGLDAEIIIRKKK